jgi:MurNAc alpha-1-phosphate uridylyltransferase
MVLAAGLGLRMRPITARIPKPLIEIGGRTMLDRMLDALAADGTERAVVNVHHLADKIRAHVAGRSRPRIEISDETDLLLETGGGVAKALGRLGGEAFVVANADIVLLDGPSPALERLRARWDETRMDALLLVHETAFATGYDGNGDYFLGPLGALRRRKSGEIAPYVFTGLQILHTRLFEGAPSGPFSLNRLYDRAEAAGRLHGLCHDGRWLHVGTPDAISGAEAALSHV